MIPARTSAAIATLRAGLWTFEKLGGVAKNRSHEVWSPDDIRDREPTIAAEGLAGAVVYPEYLTDDARLTLANVRSAADHGAVVVNYAAVRALLVADGRCFGVEVAETLPGGAERAARLTGRVIVNAAGPWVDEVRALECAGTPARLALARGVHLVVRRERLPISRTVIMNAADGRGVFAVPRGEVTYLGTTDTFDPRAEPWPSITGQDIDYLLAAAARRFASSPLTRRDIVSAWSGQRPLVAEAGKSASDISRRDELWCGPAGVLSIAGGKLTAYRRMAERVVDAVQEALGQKRRACRTAAEPLPGGDADPAAVVADLRRSGLDAAAADRLAGLYGTEAAAVMAAGGDVAAEASRAVLFEGALRLEDYWARRSARAWFDPDSLATLAPAARAMAAPLGWSTAQEAAQIAACKAIHNQDMAAMREEA